jgi:uncharacterized membrane protein/predicted DsbA family dithiol-disulfide isomerase
MTLIITNRNTVIQPLAYGVYFWTVVVLALIGLADSAYLSVSHYRIYNDIGYESFCAISRAINCDTVSQSPYAVFMRMPVPVWGVIGYIFLLLLLLFAGRRSAQKKRVWGVIFIVTLVYSIFSIILAIISHVYIDSYCIMCILVYAINLLLLYYCWLIRRRFGSEPLPNSIGQDFQFLWNWRKPATSVFIPFIAGVLLLWSLFPSYWNLQPPVLSAAQPGGLTPDGHPWIGAENGKVVITEFTDYLCFQCSKMNYYLRKMVARYPGKIKVIHRHFPMDHTVNPIVQSPVHKGAGALAILAIYSATEGKFWQTSDYLFANARFTDRVDLQALADEVGLNFEKLSRSLHQNNFRRKLHRDIIDALKLGVTGTPTFLIDGKLYSGQIPPEILSQVAD